MTIYSKKSFTLLDVIISIGIAVVGLFGIVGLLRYVIIVGRLSSDRFIATNLAEEGIELVRFYRDSNWQNYMSELGGSTFPIPPSATDYNIDYTLDPSLPFSDNAYLDTFLKIDSNGFFYSYAGITQTKFKRKITLDPTTCLLGPGDEHQCISVISRVTWDNNEIVIEDWFYNWMPHD